MAYKVPWVSTGVLCADQTPGTSSPLDSPKWFAWLAASTVANSVAALFNCQPGYSAGCTTVRKGRRIFRWVTFPAKER